MNISIVGPSYTIQDVTPTPTSSFFDVFTQNNKCTVYGKFLKDSFPPLALSFPQC